MLFVYLPNSLDTRLPILSRVVEQLLFSIHHPTIVDDSGPPWEEGEAHIAVGMVRSGMAWASTTSHHFKTTPFHHHHITLKSPHHPILPPQFGIKWLLMALSDYGGDAGQELAYETVTTKQYPGTFGWVMSLTSARYPPHHKQVTVTCWVRMRPRFGRVGISQTTRLVTIIRCSQA